MSGYKSLNNKKISFKCKNLRLILDLLNEIKNTTKPNVKQKEDMFTMKEKLEDIQIRILIKKEHI
jgi:hypothetical protein